MPGVPSELAEHSLQLKDDARLVKQTMHRVPEPKWIFISKEIDRLKYAGFIREIKKSDWLTNPVMVEKKKLTALRICVDFTALNKCCLKDHFPLPRIDQIIDSTSGCRRLSFLDAYLGYNQIKLKVEDQEKTAFITPHGVFCYQTLPFGLKTQELLTNG